MCVCEFLTMLNICTKLLCDFKNGNGVYVGNEVQESVQHEFATLFIRWDRCLPNCNWGETASRVIMTHESWGYFFIRISFFLSFWLSMAMNLIRSKCCAFYDCFYSMLKSSIYKNYEKGQFSCLIQKCQCKMSIIRSPVISGFAAIRLTANKRDAKMEIRSSLSYWQILPKPLYYYDQLRQLYVSCSSSLSVSLSLKIFLQCQNWFIFHEEIWCLCFKLVSITFENPWHHLKINRVKQKQHPNDWH